MAALKDLIEVCVSIRRGLDLSDITGSPDIKLQDYLNQLPGISGAEDLPTGRRARVFVTSEQKLQLEQELGTRCHVVKVAVGRVEI